MSLSVVTSYLPVRERGLNSNPFSSVLLEAYNSLAEAAIFSDSALTAASTLALMASLIAAFPLGCVAVVKNGVCYVYCI